MGFVQALVDTELLELVLGIQTVAALGFDGGNTQVEHLIEEAHRLFKELVLCGSTGLANGIEDTAAGAQNIQIACTAQLEGDLTLTIAAKDHVCMTVDQAGCDQLALCVNDLLGLVGTLGQLAVTCDGLDDTALDKEGGIVQLYILTLLFAAVLERADGCLQSADIFNQQHSFTY